MLALRLHLVKVAEKVVHFFRLHIVLTKLILENHQRFLEVLDARVEVSCFEADQTKGQVTLGCDNVVRSKFIFKEVFDLRNVLDRLMVVILVYWLVCRSSEQVFFCYIFLPNLNDFGEETSSFLDRLFVSEKLAHIIVRAAEVDTLGTMLLAF